MGVAKHNSVLWRALCVVASLQLVLSLSEVQNEYFVGSCAECSQEKYAICHPLEEYLRNTTTYFTTGAAFLFLPGSHTLNMTATIGDVNNLTMKAEEDEGNAVISCEQPQAGLIFENISSLELNRLTFVNCSMQLSPSVFTNAVEKYARTFLQTSVPLSAGLFMSYVSDLSMSEVTVNGSIGYGLLAVNIHGNSLFSEVIFDRNNYNSLQNETCRKSPTLYCKGGNLVLLYTDMISCPSEVQQYSLTINHSMFSHGVDLGWAYQAFLAPLPGDDAQFIGGAGVGVVMMQSSYGVDVLVENSTFTENSAYTGANMYISMYDFVDNTSITIINSAITLGNTFFGDTANLNGNYVIAPGFFFMYGILPVAVYVPTCNLTAKYQTSILTIDLCNISYNQATLPGAGLLTMWARSFTDWTRQVTMANTIVQGNTGDTTFGVLDLSNTIHNATFEFYFHNCTFIGNHYVRSSSVVASSNPQVLFLNNARFVHMVNCTFISNSGACVRSLASNVIMSKLNTFINNMAFTGTGLNMQEGSTLYLEPGSVTVFTNNSAVLFGGAIYGDMYTYKCFFQLLPTSVLDSPKFVFTGNSAGSAGDIVYANIENCLLERGILYTSDSIDVFTNISIINQPPSDSLVSGSPTVLCLCLENGEMDCDQTATFSASVFPGQEFAVNVVALGFRTSNTNALGSGFTPAMVRTVIMPDDGFITLPSSQSRQAILNGCQSVCYTPMASSNKTMSEQVQLILEPENERVFYPLLVDLTINPCPEGFVLSEQTSTCDCSAIYSSFTCNISTQTISRSGNDWVGMTNFSHVPIISHGSCALGYCNSSNVSVQLNNPDVQCETNRAGVLCSQCAENYSVAFGARNSCLQCSNDYLSLLIVFALAGVGLIVFLSVFNLTVSTGRINAFLLYVNIVRIANFPLLQEKSVFFQPFFVFISWWNLDLGIETCFYNGLDVYAKTWLQYVFPSYVYLLLILSILAANRSITVSNLLPENTLSVFATVILISFTKVLRTTTVAFPYSMITTENGSVLVWKFDASKVYLSFPHLSLLLVSCAVFMVFVVLYTTVLLAYPFLWSFTAHENTVIEKVVCYFRKRLFKLKPFLDKHDGPYKDKVRYWTGLLLVIRIVIFFVVLSTEETTTFLRYIIIVPVTMALVGAGTLLRIYMCPVNSSIENLFFLNLGVLEFVLLIMDLTRASSIAQAVVLCVSISFSFVLFVFSSVYQFYYEIKKKRMKRLERASTPSETREQTAVYITRAGTTMLESQSSGRRSKNRRHDSVLDLIDDERGSSAYRMIVERPMVNFDDVDYHTSDD